MPKQIHKIRECQCLHICLQVCLCTCTIALISLASKVMLKLLQSGLQQYVKKELPDVQAGFRKVRGTKDQIANICWIIEKAKEFQKNIYFCFTDFTVFDCVDHSKLWKILKDIEITDQCQGCILSPCLFNLSAEYIMRNAGLNHILIPGWITNWNQGCQDKYQPSQIRR